MLAKSMLEMMNEGGWVLWVIAFCSVASLGITMERLRTMRKADVDSEGLLARLADALDGRRIPEAIAMCDQAGGPVGETLGIGLRRMQILESAGKTPEEIEEGIVGAMEEHGMHVVSFLERNLTTLATMASLAPILGMLGTVMGMIGAFMNLAASKTADMSGVGHDISMALHCTAGGLIVAALATVEFNYFTNRVNRFSLQVQAAATKLVERLLHLQAIQGHKEGLAK